MVNTSFLVLLLHVYAVLGTGSIAWRYQFKLRFINRASSRSIDSLLSGYNLYAGFWVSEEV